MKKFIIFLWILYIFSFISAYAQNKEAQDEEKITKISITIEDTKELIPDFLEITVKVNVTTEKEIDAINILGEVDKSLRNLGFEYEGGKYSVEKNCWWEGNIRKCLGYKGSICYIFELKQPSDQNKIFEILSDFKEEYSKEMEFSVSEPKWIVSKKNLHEVEEELKIGIIDIAKNYAQKFSEKLGKSCDITNINYEVKRPLWGELFLKGAVVPSIMPEAVVEAPEPKKEEKMISVKASVKISCK